MKYIDQLVLIGPHIGQNPNVSNAKSYSFNEDTGILLEGDITSA